MKLRLTFAASLLVAALPLKAKAQTVAPWLADRRYGEGAGIRTGNLEVHPGIAAELGYDSNYFLRAPSENPIAAGRLRVTPSLSLSTLGPERRQGVSPSGPAVLKFRAGAFAAYNELFGSTEVSNQRHVDLGATLRLDAFPQGRVGVDTYADYLRIVQPSNDVNTENAFDRDTVRLGAGATWRPGGGLFSWRAGYEFGYNYFEDQPFKIYNNYQHTGSLRGRWRFLPRTAFLYDGQYTWIQYAGGGPHTNGNLLRSSIGLNGLVTNNLGFLGMIGWGASFYDAVPGGAAQQFDSITAHAELKWFITPQQSLDVTSAPVGISFVVAGYNREFNNSYLGDFDQRDRGYLGLSYMLGGVVVTDLQAGLSNVSFPATSFPNGGGPRQGAFSEQRVDAQLFSEYRFSDSWGVNTTIRYDQNITNTKLALVPGATNQNNPAQFDDLRFQRWQAFLGLRWFM